MDLSAITPLDLILWDAGWSLVAFLLMGVDKAQARAQVDRISERTLHEVALIGGFAGIIGGGFFFHHKTSKGNFWLPVGVAVVLWIAIYLAFVSVRD
jgi:uncharacterized membrane protein YsdA (DUF1294 family)